MSETPVPHFFSTLPWISASSNIILPDTFTPRSCSKRPFNVFKNVVFPQPKSLRIAVIRFLQIFIDTLWRTVFSIIRYIQIVDLHDRIVHIGFHFIFPFIFPLYRFHCFLQCSAYRAAARLPARERHRNKSGPFHKKRQTKTPVFSKRKLAS